jgi:uncharacterized Zn-finger protein
VLRDCAQARSILAVLFDIDPLPTLINSFAPYKRDHGFFPSPLDPLHSFKTYSSPSFGEIAERQRKYLANFVCDRCSRAFTRRFNLVEHLNLAHSGVSRHFCCSTCRKLFLRAKDRNRHQCSQHSNEHRFVCDRLPERNGIGCSKAFRRWDALKENREKTQYCLTTRDSSEPSGSETSRAKSANVEPTRPGTDVVRCGYR